MQYWAGMAVEHLDRGYQVNTEQRMLYVNERK